MAKNLAKKFINPLLHDGRNWYEFCCAQLYGLVHIIADAVLIIRLVSLTSGPFCKRPSDQEMASKGFFADPANDPRAAAAAKERREAELLTITMRLHSGKW